MDAGFIILIKSYNGSLCFLMVLLVSNLNKVFCDSMDSVFISIISFCIVKVSLLLTKFSFIDVRDEILLTIFMLINYLKTKL